MMGYTHAIVGAAGAVALATFSGNTSPELFIIATVAGAIGGVSIDVDSKDHKTNPKVTDASRSRLAISGMLFMAVLLDALFNIGVIRYIIANPYLPIGGIVAFLILGLIGHFSEHRTFSHSLLFILLTSFCVFLVYPEASQFYSSGAILHLLLDMLNHPYNDHGVFLLYPIRKRKGIALGLCKSARAGNKAFYFIGLILYLAVSALYFCQLAEIKRVVPTIILLVCMVFAMEIVRRKSEKEQRHIMHIRGEI